MSAGRAGDEQEEEKALGSKTALLAYAAEDPVESLRQAREFDPEATRALVAATSSGMGGRSFSGQQPVR